MPRRITYVILCGRNRLRVRCVRPAHRRDEKRTRVSSIMTMSFAPLRARVRSRWPALRFGLLIACLLAAPRDNAGRAAVQDGSNGTDFRSAAGQFAISDFDGDSRPDLASVEVGTSDSDSSSYRIDFRLANGAAHALNLAAPRGGLELVSRDVNGDNYPDVIVTTLWTKQPVAILLNDGAGNFTRTDPSLFRNAFRTFAVLLPCASASYKEAAALSSRACGDCIGRAVSLLRAPAGAPLALTRVPSRSSVPGASFLGRAPPFIPLHL